MENRDRQIKRITLWSVAANTLLTVCKIIAGILGRSAAMVADGIHSLSDLLSDAVVLVFTHISAKGKDRDHSFGHGKFETLATLIVRIIPKPGYIAAAAAVISIAAKEILYRVTAKVGKEANSPAVIANAWHHRSDALSSIGSLAGISGAILLGDKWTILDPIASCIISVAIIIVGVKMAIPNLAELLEASLPEEMEEEIVRIALSVDGVNDIHDLKTRRNGISVIIDAHIVVDPQMTVTQAHEIATQAEDRIREKFGQQTQVSTHIEPDKTSR